MVGFIQWNDRLKMLVDAGDYLGSLEMAMGFFKNTGSHIAFGLPQDSKDRDRLLIKAISECLQTYVDQSTSAIEDVETNSPHYQSNFSRLSNTCFDVCLAISRDDLLFNEIYDKFCERGLEYSFLDTLEQYMLNDRLKSTYNPIIFQSLIKYLKSSNLDLPQIIDPTTTSPIISLGICMECTMSFLGYSY